MQFPNEIQAALLFDQPFRALDEVVRSFQRLEQMQGREPFHVPEANPGAFCRLFGQDDLMLTLEYLAQPADMGVFQQPLASAITGMLCPDIRQRLTGNRSHVLVTVAHGVTGNAPEVAQIMAEIGRPMEGHSLPQFCRRLDACATIARLACDEMMPQVVHWTQSNQLIAGENFERCASVPAPGPLHIHPYLFGDSTGAGGNHEVGVLTFGARHFIGREISVDPGALPWTAHFETILAFLKVATTDNGYVIPHGDTFGPEDRSASYRVLHCEPEAEGAVPLYQLIPLMRRDHGFQSADYVPPERVFDDSMPPADLMPDDDEAKAALANEWREKRGLAEGIGGRFEVRAKGPAPTGPQPPRPVFGAMRKIFGRKIT
jgi:hypothetical protein